MIEINRKPIRVLHVLHKMDLAGAETLVMNIYRTINREEIQFDFMLHSEMEGAYDREIRKLGGKMYYVPPYKVSNHIEYKNKWRKFFDEHNEYRILHAHSQGPAGVYLKIAKKYGLYTIAHSHNIANGMYLSSIAKYFMQKKVKYLSDTRLSCSEQAGIWLFGNKPFKVIPNGIKVENFLFDEKTEEKMRHEFKIKDEFVVGHIGRFSKQKNHEFLIEIFAEVCKLNAHSKLLLIGDGELKKDIEDKVRKLGIDEKVIFAGLRSDINKVIMAMDVFVLPSLYEGLGIVLIEAQAAGLNCFASAKVPKEANVSGQVDFLDLNISPKEWAEHILKKEKCIQRTQSQQKIKDAGYDIIQSTEYLAKLYLDKS